MAKAGKKAPQRLIEDGAPVVVIIGLREYEEMLERLEDLENLKALRRMRTNHCLLDGSSCGDRRR